MTSAKVTEAREVLDEAGRARFDASWEAEPNTGCWLWLRTWNDSGYGRFHTQINGRCHRELAHRLSWRMHRGPIPDGLCVLHKCDTRACVNPDHLFLGTLSDNVHDAIRKGRHVTRPVIGLATRLAIGMAPRSYSNASLSAMFGVVHQQGSRFRRGRDLHTITHRLRSLSTASKGGAR